MDDINLFLELGKIKKEIQYDLIKLKELSDDLDLKSIYKNNRDLSDQIYILNQNFTNKIDLVKNQNSQLQKEVLKMGSTIGAKEEEIDKLNRHINKVEDEKKKFEQLYKQELEKNLNLNASVKYSHEKEKLIEENKAFLFTLFE